MGVFDRLFGQNSSAPRGASPTDFQETFAHWTAGNDIARSRKFLESHLELLRPETDQLFELILYGLAMKGYQPSLIALYRSHWAVLRRARATGGTRQAIRDAYVDEFSALRALDLPPWLTAARDRIFSSIHQSEAETIALIRHTMARVRKEPGLEPEILATTEYSLGLLVGEQVPAEAITLFINAANVFIPQRFPKRFSEVQGALGAIFLMRAQNHDTLRGGQQDARQALPYLEAALRYFPREENWEQWVQLHLYLSGCCYMLHRYDDARQVLLNARAALPASAPPGLIRKIQNALEAVDKREDLIEKAFSMLASTDAARLRREWLGDEG